MQGFIKYQALGKQTSCEDNFAQLVWPSRQEFFLQRSSFLCPPVENASEAFE